MATFTQPDFTTQTAAAYKANIDASINVVGEIGQQFAPHETSTPGMTVLIDAGRLTYGGTLASQAQQTTSTITAPTTNPRIDRIVINEQTGVYSIVTGTEAASPSAPAIPTGKLPVCQFTLETTTTAIINSMITDERATQSATNPAYPAFRAYYSGSSYAYTSGGLITTDIESFDKTNDFDNATTYRFTPTVAGVYQVNAHAVVLEGTAGVGLDLYINKNGTDIAVDTEISTGNAKKMSLGVDSLVEMNGTTDYLTITIAASTTIYGGGIYSGRGTFFEAFRVQG